MLARLLQLTVLWILIFAGTWLAVLWDQHPIIAIAGCLLSLFLYVPVLALEFLLARRVNRTDPAPQAGLSIWLSAWWGEMIEILRVFFWRQPFFWNAVPDDIEDAFGHRGRRGVVFIHGFVCNRGLWTPWLVRLLKDRRAFVAVNLTPVFGSIDRYAVLINDAVAQVTTATGMPPLVVCHSMGGLAVRAWLRSGEGADQRVHHIVTIGTPHQGTWLGRFGSTTNGRQMRIGNTWLQQLGASEPTGRSKLFTCFYSNCDNIVFPASTATLAGADNRFVDGVAHLALAFDQTVMRESLAKI